MTFGANLFQGAHRTQFDGSTYQSSNCVPASLGDAVEAVTGGRNTYSGGFIRNLIPREDETDPSNPGWSLTDADKAMAKLGISFVQGKGTWADLLTFRDSGRALILQGDSDVFTSGCSATFDGGHCIALPPLDHSDGRWRIGDPLCSDWRWEDDALIKSYAGKFAGSGQAWFGYTEPVPQILPDTAGDDTVTLVMPIPAGNTGHVSSSGPVTIYVPDGSAKKTVTLTMVKADVAEYSINQSDNSAPKGGPFRRLAEKPHAGYYVASASVQWFPPSSSSPTGDVKHVVDLQVDGASKWKGNV